jgi:hypothetical protein
MRHLASDRRPEPAPRAKSQAGHIRSRDLRLTALAVSALLGLTAANAQTADPFLLYEDSSTTVRATLQFGANLVSEGNLF